MKTSVFGCGAVAFAALFTFPSPASSQSGVITATSLTTARDHPAPIGDLVTYTCPPGTPFGFVFGTDVYADISSICTAAAHAGLMTFDSGGTVTIEICPGLDDYVGSAAYDVYSANWTRAETSFVFTGTGIACEDAPPSLLAPPGADLSYAAATPRADRGRSFERFSYYCPPNGYPVMVYGTGVYADESSVCTAAVHAELITFRDGGTVTIELCPGRTSHAGSVGGGGVASFDYGPSGGSFVFPDTGTECGGPVPLVATYPDAGQPQAGDPPAVGDPTAVSDPTAVGPPPAPPPGPSRVANLRAEFVGLDRDVVSNGSESRPDGATDGHFRMQATFLFWQELSHVAVYSSDAAGNPTGGQRWDTRNGTYWMLGVMTDDMLITPQGVSSVGKFQGDVTLDLYAGDSGWFQQGNTVVVELGLGGSEIVATVVPITTGAAAPPTAGPPAGPPAAAAPIAGAVTAMEAGWIGVDADVVSNNEVAATPDGAPDGHFFVDLEAQGSPTLSYAAIYSADAGGTPVGGHVWHTQPNAAWILGSVAGGQLLHAGKVPILGQLSPGRTRLDLYAGNSGYFNPGQHFLVLIGFPDGTDMRRVIQLPGAMAQPPGPPAPSQPVAGEFTVSFRPPTQPVSPHRPPSRPAAGTCSRRAAVSAPGRSDRPNRRGLVLLGRAVRRGGIELGSTPGRRPGALGPLRRGGRSLSPAIRSEPRLSRHDPGPGPPRSARGRGRRGRERRGQQRRFQRADRTSAVKRTCAQRNARATLVAMLALLGAPVTAPAQTLPTRTS